MGTGRQVIKLTRRNASEDSLNFGHDVTFLELIQFVLWRNKFKRIIDEHFAPMYSRCYPCKRKQFYLGKLETFSDDASFIISKLAPNNSDFELRLENNDIASTLNEALNRVGALFTLLNTTQQLNYSRHSLFLRTWRDFQIRGLLSKAFEMPLSEQEVMNISQKQFETILKSALSKPMNKTVVKSQRNEALMQAYSALPRDVLQDLKQYVGTDCDLFGYDREPEWLFGPALRNNDLNTSFNYFDTLMKTR